jgi:hypothetical protein
MKFYTTAQLGPKRARTASGALICFDVPIARTGLQIYGPNEIRAGPNDPPIEPGPNGYIKVEREPEEVFRPQTIASFEGAPIVNDHPSEDVNPGNWRRYAMGNAQHVHRGEGIEDSLLFADLVIQDEEAIQAIMEGKRQVSCGYGADYKKLGDGHYAQTNIVGNHIALVDSARCGPRCSIGDDDNNMPPVILAAVQRRRIRHIHLHLSAGELGLNRAK